MRRLIFGKLFILYKSCKWLISSIINKIYIFSVKSFLEKHLNYSVFFIILFVLISIKIINPSFVKSVSYLSFDLYQKLFSEKKDSEVIIIDIDEQSLGKFGQFPWNRTVFAKILETSAISPTEPIAS